MNSLIVILTSWIAISVGVTGLWIILRGPNTWMK